MKLYKQLCLFFLTFCLVSLSSNSLIFAFDLNNNSMGNDIIEELALPSYNGRQSGTFGYDLAVKYLEQKLESSALIPLINGTFKQTYNVNVATIKSEQLVANGKKMELMKDYMPFSRCTSGKFVFTNGVYVGAGISTDYTSNVDGVVVFNWFDKSGKFPEGATDRILRAKNKGAKAVLVIANGELEIGNYEHPLGGVDIGIPVFYISQELASNSFGINSSFNHQQITNMNFVIDFQIERKPSQSTNLVGVLEGKNQGKAILITTNLDGFGSLPDGRYFQSIKAGVVAPSMFFDLIDYYHENKPEYSIIFAIVGSKWTDNSGIKALVGILDFDKIISAIDVYAMGGNGSPYIGYTNLDYAEFAEKISKYASYNDDTGNSLSSIIKEKTSKLFIIRDGNTWVDNSLSDTKENFSQQGYIVGFNFLTTFINKIMSENLQIDESFIYDSTLVKTEFFEEIRKSIDYVESKYFNVYYDEEFKSKITNAYLKEIDIIFERISSNNYYPKINDKVKLLYLNNGNDAAIIAGREDLIGHSEKAGGGFASFNKLVIFCKSASLVTVSHELNHLLVNMGGIGKEEGVLQECQGQSYLIYYNDMTYVETASSLINNYLQNHEAPKVISNAMNYETTLDWKVYTQNADDPDGWQNSYHILGSMYSYINFKFGPNAARRAIYRIYENKADITYALCKDINCTIEEFLEGWSVWMNSSGRNTSSIMDAKAKDYVDNLEQYDAAKIFTLNNSTYNGFSYQPTLSSSDNGFSYQLTLSSSDMKVNSFKVERLKTEFIFTLDYESNLDMGLCFFNPPNGDKIKILKILNGIQKGKHSTTISVDATKLLSVDSIIINFFNDKYFKDYISFDTTQLKSLQQYTPDSLNEANALPTNSKVIVNGKELAFEAYNINGNNYFKLRDLALAINGSEKQFEVTWDSVDNAINLKSNEAYTVVGGELFLSGSSSTKVASKTTSKVYLDEILKSLAAYNINGNNYFKLRDVGNIINFGVLWDALSNTISINTAIEYTW